VSREQLTELSTPFPKELIKQPAPGKHGTYVKHSTVNERLLSAIGPFDFEVIEVIRGRAEEVVGKNQTWAAREGAVVGCLARMTVNIDGRPTTVTEVGDVEEPAMNNDGRNAKDASSDAFKRCAMRLGLGLHLWSQEKYFLHSQLVKDYGDESRPSLPGASAAVGGAEDSVQLHSEPPPAAQETGTLAAAIADHVPVMDMAASHPDDIVTDNVVELHPEDDEAWTELLNILSEKPDDGTMGIIQDRCRRLYTFMATTGLWTEGARVAALKQHYDTTHLTNLQRASLVEFAKHSFDAAKAKVTEEPDHG